MIDPLNGLAHNRGDLRKLAQFLSNELVTELRRRQPAHGHGSPVISATQGCGEWHESLALGPAGMSNAHLAPDPLCAFDARHVVVLDHGCALGPGFGRQVRRNKISVLRLIRELIEGALNTIFALLIFAVAASMLLRSAEIGRAACREKG